MAIITEVLVTAKIIAEFKVPIWVILSAHAAIALGTFRHQDAAVRRNIENSKVSGKVCDQTLAPGPSHGV
jgi:hypothetical protein